MACVTIINYVALINGVPTNFFKAHRGLRQDCALSPLLFLLIINGMSRKISMAKIDTSFFGLQVRKKVIITHLMFVDDVLIFGWVYISQWKDLILIISKSGDAYGIFMSNTKLLLIHTSD